MVALTASIADHIKPYSRWRALVKTTPSGKKLFVCLVCGTVTPAPGKCAGEVTIHSGGGSTWTTTCEEVEKEVNDKIVEDDALLVAHAEKRLLNDECRECGGSGCAICVSPPFKRSMRRQRNQRYP